MRTALLLNDPFIGLFAIFLGARTVFLAIPSTHILRNEKTRSFAAYGKRNRFTSASGTLCGPLQKLPHHGGKSTSITPSPNTVKQEPQRTLSESLPLSTTPEPPVEYRNDGITSGQHTQPTICIMSN